MQQDADECLGQLLQALSRKMTDKVPDASKSNVIDYLFAGDMKETITCAEADSDPPKVTTTKFLKLRCHIDTQTNHMNFGIGKSLEETLEFNSASLGRNAQHTRVSRISSLPRYTKVVWVDRPWINHSSDYLLPVQVFDGAICAFFLESGHRKEGQDSSESHLPTSI